MACGVTFGNPSLWAEGVVTHKRARFEDPCYFHPLPPRPVSQSKPPPPCRKFLRSGVCPFGNFCKFSHVNVSSSPSVNTLAQPVMVPSTPLMHSQQDANSSHPLTTTPSGPQSDYHASVIDQSKSVTSPNLEVNLPSIPVLQDANAYVVKIPSQRQKSKPRPMNTICLRKAQQPRLKSLAALDIFTGHLDLFLFDIPSVNSTPVVKLPSSHRQTHASNRRCFEPWDPRPTAKQDFEEESGQISDSSDDSLSDDFSNLSMASSNTSVGLSQDAFDVLGARGDPVHVKPKPRDREPDGSSEKPRERLPTGVFLIDRQQPISSLSDDYLANAPEKPPGLEHIRPLNMNGRGSSPPSFHSVTERRQMSGLRSTAKPFSKTAGNLTVIISDHSKVKFGPGFEVLELTTGFESRWIQIRDLPSDIKADEVRRLLEPFGSVTELRHAKGSSTAKAQFSELSEAVQAATALNGAVVFDSTITASVSVGSAFSRCKVQDSTVWLIWEPPGRIGYAGYSTLSDAEAAMAAAVEPLRGCYIVPSLYQGLPSIGAYTVRFHGLPPDVVAEDLKNFGHTEDVMLERPNYNNPKTPSRIIRQYLESFGDTTFEHIPPSSKERLNRAWITFSSPQIAAAATEFLNSQRIPLLRRCKFRAHHIKTVSYHISHQSYLKILSDLIALRDSCSTRFSSGICLKFGGHGFSSRIRATGENLRDLRSLKADIEAILYGEVIREDGKPVWDRFFSQFVGKAYLESLSRDHPSTFIRPDVARRFIIVLGPVVARKIVRERILQKVAELKRQKVRLIPLAGRIIGFFMSADLYSLQKQLGPENVMLSLGERALKIRGNDQAFEMAREVVRRAEQNQGKLRRTASECPVCFSEAICPVTLDCGHAWCKTCLSDYLVAATDNKLFPLTCLGNEATCPDLIPITIAQEILPAANFDALVNASFTTYVHSRPDQFYYCPTPDCQQIYRTATQSTVLQCPACLVRICPVCHVEYHDGFECADRSSSSNSSGGEQKFWEWSREHNIKPCPGCKAPIERSEGCNHLTCTRCHTHICWACMKTFPKGQDVYDHMRAVHGGIGI